MVANIKSMGVNGGAMNEIDITDIADWFLSKESMTHKKLQKLCYYAVAWGWTLMGKHIAQNDEFQAWVHGPVSPVLYENYKSLGWNLIDRPKRVKDFPPDILELLESVWATYADRDGNELEALSHRESPWINARRGIDELQYSQQPISFDDIKVYYGSIHIAE